MNREKMLELLSVSIDRKASLTICFSQFHKDNKWKPVTEEEAHDLISQFSEALGAKNIIRETGAAGTEHFRVDIDDIYINCSFIPETKDAKKRRIEQLKQELAELENEGVRA